MDAQKLRFRFGENWRSFVDRVEQVDVIEAERGLRKLFPNNELMGARFLDVGCGSGLSMLASRLGASYVHGIDVDAQSVLAARTLLNRFQHCVAHSVEARNLFDLSGEPYDVVYSWGVLHHSGAVWKALEHVRRLVRPGGLLAIALYRRSPCCPFWRIEKRLYSQSPSAIQAIVRLIYKTFFLAGIAATARSPLAYIRDSRGARGMNFHHDVHDWLGGYPYESVSPAEVSAFLTDHGFSIERSLTRPVAVKGLFGPHCDEYVARLER